MIYKKHKYISTIIPGFDLQSIEDMMVEHYDIPKYDGVTFLINTICYKDRNINRNDIPNIDKNSKLIFYNLEHYDFYLNENRWLPIYNKWLEKMNFEEIWDFNIENIKCKQALNPKFQSIQKFMPLRYTQSLLDEPLDVPKKFDFGFVGKISIPNYAHRMYFFQDVQILNELQEEYYKPIFKVFFGQPIKQLKSELSNCKYILDILNTKKTKTQICTQNQVRIFELIMRGYNVITEDINGLNYFPNMTEIFSYPYDEDRKDGYYYGIEFLDKLQQPFEDKHIQNRELYKQMTYTDEAFKKYKHDLEVQYNYLISLK